LKLLLQGLWRGLLKWFSELLAVSQQNVSQKYNSTNSILWDLLAKNNLESDTVTYKVVHLRDVPWCGELKRGSELHHILHMDSLLLHEKIKIIQQQSRRSKLPSRAKIWYYTMVVRIGLKKEQIWYL
jgi:hypothetical protein